MKSYYRESYKVNDHVRFITYYTPSEYLLISIVKFLAFLFIVWPIEIGLWLITLPFRLVWKLDKSRAPIVVKIIVTITFIILIITLLAYLV